MSAAVVPLLPPTVDASRAIAVFVAFNRHEINQRAKRLADGDRQLARELAHAAMVELWNIDVARYGQDERWFVMKIL
jgi:hypothetical protein